MPGLISTNHAEALIRSFVVPEKQPRLIESLGNPRRRAKVLQSLAHFSGLDPRFATRVPPRQQTAEEIAGLLRAKGAPETCYLLSEKSDLDGQTMALQEALAQVVGRGFGSFLSCLPGRLAYFESEEPGERYVLERRSGTATS